MTQKISLKLPMEQIKLKIISLLGDDNLQAVTHKVAAYLQSDL